MDDSQRRVFVVAARNIDGRLRDAARLVHEANELIGAGGLTGVDEELNQLYLCSMQTRCRYLCQVVEYLRSALGIRYADGDPEDVIEIVGVRTH